ncbi:MAG: hypothetical protein A2Z31_07590 [candidate division NC10 bacterium RBG_16_65_8]|nr:MAG: hypothetical protein A2Z31_07590 [candidate division NC10 bacterium RBG_16_65_8]
MGGVVPKIERDIVLPAIAKEAEEQRSQQLFANLTASVDREGILAILEILRSEEEDHLARLRSMRYGPEADRPGRPSGFDPSAVWSRRPLCIDAGGGNANGGGPGSL